MQNAEELLDEVMENRGEIQREHELWLMVAVALVKSLLELRDMLAKKL